jgi:hypothetical protein
MVARMLVPFKMGLQGSLQLLPNIAAPAARRNKLAKGPVANIGSHFNPIRSFHRRPLILCRSFSVESQ